ncbi:MAG: hypothetical protein ABSB73_09195 [Solirubrobacteraceae bacterium]|jgi:hypothetical protein
MRQPSPAADATILIELYDAIDVDAIPADAQAAASYCDLDYAAGWPALLARFPQLAEQGRLVSIAGLASTRARIYDVEPGNPMAPADVPDAIKASIAAGIYRPGAYAPVALMADIRAALDASGLTRDQYVLWLADWDGVAALDDWDAAKQYRNAGAYDVSVCLPDFFAPLAPTPAPAPPLPEEDSMIAVGLNAQGDFHVFQERADGSIWFTVEPHGTSAWGGGEPGKQIAGLTLFSPAPAPGAGDVEAALGDASP